MSGEKNQVISTYRYEQLMRESRDLSDLKRAYNANQELIRRQNEELNRARTRQSNLENRINALDSKNTAIRKETQTLRAQLNQAVSDHKRALTAQAAQFRQQIVNTQAQFDSSIKNLREDVNNTIDSNNKAIEAALNATAKGINDRISDVKRGLQTEIKNVKDQLDLVVRNIKEDNDTLLAMAEEYYRTAADLNNDTANYFTFLIPEKWQSSGDTQFQADSDIKQARDIGAYSSVACNNARIAFETALQTHHEAVMAQEEWIAHHSMALNALGATQSFYEINRVVEPEDEEGCKTEIDTDKWSNGTMSALGKRISEIESHLKNAEDEQLTTEDIDGLIAALNQINNEIESTVAFSVCAYESSVVREETSDLILDRFGAAFSQISSGFKGNDERCEHLLIMRDPITGYTLRFTQTPEVRDEIMVDNKIVMQVVAHDILDRNNAETFIHNNEKQIKAVLNSIGAELEVSASAAMTTPEYESTPVIIDNPIVDPGQVITEWENETANAPAPALNGNQTGRAVST